MLDFDEAQISNDLYMTKEMIASLAKAGLLGTHGHSHRALGLLNDTDAINDFQLSITKIREWTKTTVKTMSYPFGFKEACSNAVAYHAKKNKIKFAFTMERAYNNDLNNPLFLARFSNSDAPGGNNCKDTDAFWITINKASWH
jgi:hypothetical protein